MTSLKEILAPQPVQKPGAPPVTPQAAGGVPGANPVSTVGDARVAVAATAKPNTSTAKPAPTAPATAAPAAQPQDTTTTQSGQPIVPGNSQMQAAQPGQPPQPGQPRQAPNPDQLLERIKELAGMLRGRHV